MEGQGPAEHQGKRVRETPGNRSEEAERRTSGHHDQHQADVTETASLPIDLQRSWRRLGTRPAEQESDCRAGSEGIVAREGTGRSGTTIPEMRVSGGQPGAFLHYAAVGCSDVWVSFTPISDT